MITVKKIKTARSKGYIRLSIESECGEFDLTVEDSVYMECGSPEESERIDGGTFDVFSDSDLRYRAKLCALRAISCGDVSEGMLYKKLRAKKIPHGAAAETVRDMVRLGYVDEKRQLRHMITVLVAERCMGPALVRSRLVGKGYKGASVDSLIAELSDSGEIDFELSKERLMKAKLPENASEEEIKKLLFKNGYNVC